MGGGDEIIDRKGIRSSKSSEPDVPLTEYNTSGPTFADRNGLDNDGGMKQRCYSLVHSVRILRCELVHTYVQSLQDHPTKGRASKTFIFMHGKMTGDVIPPCSEGISAKQLNG